MLILEIFLRDGELLRIDLLLRNLIKNFLMETGLMAMVDINMTVDGETSRKNLLIFMTLKKLTLVSISVVRKDFLFMI